MCRIGVRCRQLPHEHVDKLFNRPDGEPVKKKTKELNKFQAIPK